VTSPWLPRLLLGVGAAALLGAIISISVGSGGPKVVKIEGGNEVQQLLGGVEQEGPYLGPPDASVTIGVFTDLQCSTCDDYQLETVDPLISEYARPGDARLQFHNYSLGEAEVTQAAYAATAAAEQDREWHFAELFFRNQDNAPGGTVTEEFLDDIGLSISDFDLDTWHEDIASPEVKERVDADQRLAADYGLRVEGPSIVVDGPRGTEVLQDGPSQAEVDAAVARVGGP
jgi:protein-disulfide isomerase